MIRRAADRRFKAARRGGARPRLPVADPPPLPRPGELGVFDRSHYEDVLVVPVRGLVRRRDGGGARAINGFEAAAGRQRNTLVKVISAHPQGRAARRLLARLDDPTKNWKYNPDDLKDRGYWADYMAASAEESSAATLSRRRGTSSPPTASGTATGRSRSC